MEGMGSPFEDPGEVKRSGLYSCRLLGDEGQSISRAFCLPPRRPLQRAPNLAGAVRPRRFKLSLKLLQAGHDVASVDLGERMRQGLWGYPGDCGRLLSGSSPAPSSVQTVVPTVSRLHGLLEVEQPG